MIATTIDFLNAIDSPLIMGGIIWIGMRIENLSVRVENLERKK